MLNPILVSAFVCLLPDFPCPTSCRHHPLWMVLTLSHVSYM